MELGDLSQYTKFPDNIDEPSYVSNIKANLLSQWQEYQNLVNEAIKATSDEEMAAASTQMDSYLSTHPELTKSLNTADLQNRIQAGIAALQLYSKDMKVDVDNHETTLNDHFRSRSNFQILDSENDDYTTSLSMDKTYCMLMFDDSADGNITRLVLTSDGEMNLYHQGSNDNSESEIFSSKKVGTWLPEVTVAAGSTTATIVSDLITADSIIDLYYSHTDITVVETQNVGSVGIVFNPALTKNITVRARVTNV